MKIYTIHSITFNGKYLEFRFSDWDGEKLIDLDNPDEYHAYCKWDHFWAAAEKSGVKERDLWLYGLKGKQIAWLGPDPQFLVNFFEIA
ncbi:hypothetical protein [Larkinella harenae]